MDIYEVKRKYGDKVCLIGNIDLTNKTPEEIEKDVEEDIDRLTQNGGYVVSPNNSITENFSFREFYQYDRNCSGVCTVLIRV